MERISHYRVVRRIGAGGMGEVWLAVDERLGREVALKLLGRRATAERARRMMREAQAASALNHPGIVTVHDVGEHDGQPYVVMELVEGQRFSELGRLPPAEALRLCVLAADALGAAHERGILHRDVKSDNLMRLPDGRVKVLDFGLAKVLGAGTSSSSDGDAPRARAVSPTAATHAAGRDDQLDEPGFAPTLDSADRTPVPPDRAGAPTLDTGRIARSPPASQDLTRAGDVMGTPAYMSPEQARGQPADARSEVFSLGVVLYELLCGRRPFLAADIEGTLELVQRARVTPPSIATQDPGLAFLDPLIARCLARDPADRPADMRTLAQLLRAASAPARPRRRVLVAAGALGIAAAAAGGVLALEHRSIRAPASPPAPPGPSLPSIVESSRLTVDPDCEEFPVVSPDGSHVVFDAAHGDRYALVESDGKHERDLTSGPGWNIAPALSPDGKQLAFLHKGDGPYVAMVGDAELTRPARQVAVGAMRPRFSPDGRSLWAGDAHHPTRWNLATGRAERTLAPPPGLVVLEPLELPDGTVAGLMLKPDGASFPVGIAAFDAAGKMRWLYQGELDEVLAPAPGGRGVIASRVAARTRELVMVPVAGGPPVPLHAPDVQAHKGLAATADWSAIVWSDCGEQFDIAVVELGAGQPSFAPVAEGAWADIEPVPVPGTSELVVLSDRTETVRPWLIDREGKTPARMIADVEPARIDVSHDGKLLIYATDAGELWKAPLDGSSPPVRLAQQDGLTAPAIGPDGTIYVATGGGQIATVPLGGGTPTAAFAGAEPAPSPAGRLLAFARGPDGEQTLILRTLATGSERPLAAALPPGNWNHVRFSADGRWVAAMRGQGEIDLVEVASGKVTGRITGTSRTFLGLGFVADRLVVAENWWRGDVWIGHGDGYAARHPDLVHPHN